ncbi:MAG: DUF4180 domain-containing protein [Oscillospiraceae bacterium]|jgi:hypothetical protein|nr:DUF4180 domain-containing protein [Oscillospiraceae bacterium]
MNITIKNGIAIVRSDVPVITDGQSALDFMASISYGCNVGKIALNKAAVAEDFFRLSTGLAGEVAQKFVNFRIQFAIIGDFSGYTSEPLQAFIRESNRGRHMFFVGSEDEAVEKLSGK